jgi:DUF4097 and DUF4098 domain-containing protein YvlB
MATHETPGHVSLRLGVPSGSVTVRSSGIDRTEIEVRAHLDDEVSARVLESMTESVRETAPGEYEVKLEIPTRGKRWGIFQNEREFEVRVLVPENADLDVETISADVTGEGRFGSVRARTTSGDISIEEAGGAAEFKTLSGDVEVETAGATVRAQSISGDVRMRSVAADLIGKTVSGDFQIGSVGRAARVTSVSGDVGIESASAGEVIVKTTSGDIRIGVRSGVSVWMDVSSLSGETTSGLEPSEGDQGSQLEVRATSVSGDVTLHSASATAVL